MIDFNGNSGRYNLDLFTGYLRFNKYIESETYLNKSVLLSSQNSRLGDKLSQYFLDQNEKETSEQPQQESSDQFAGEPSLTTTLDEVPTPSQIKAAFELLSQSAAVTQTQAAIEAQAAAAAPDAAEAQEQPKRQPLPKTKPEMH